MLHFFNGSPIYCLEWYVAHFFDTKVLKKGVEKPLCGDYSNYLSLILSSNSLVIWAINFSLSLVAVLMVAFNSLGIS